MTHEASRSLASDCVGTPAGAEYHPPPNATEDPRVPQLRQLLGLDPTPGVTYPPNATDPWLVGCRADALVLAYRLDPCRLSRNVDERLRLAAATGTVELNLGALLVALRSDPRGSFARFENADLRGTLDWRATGGWHVELVPRAMFLATHSLEEAIALCDTCARAFAPVVEGPRLRRVDLAADFMHFALGATDATRLATTRSSITEFSVEPKDVDDVRERAHASAIQMHMNSAQRVTGFSISSGNPISARIYDKTTELRCPGRDEKRVIEHGIWSARGWTGGGPVVRVEFQLRGAFLDDIKLRDAYELSTKLDELWQYCARWLRMVDPTSASRRYRCTLDPRWQAVQTVQFNHKASPIGRARKRGGANARNTLGTVLSHQASFGALPRLCVTPDADGVCLDEATSVGHLTDEQATRQVRNELGVVFTRTASDIAAALIAEHGPRRALAFFRTRHSAAIARFSSIDDRDARSSP